jgi:AGZA family xanthine/uracil permease-like MFS transporter
MAIALCLIAFTQMPKIAASPLVGFASLAIVLATLIARGRLPFRIPGALGAVLAGCLVWYLMKSIDVLFQTGLVPATDGPVTPLKWFPTEWLAVFQFHWLSSMKQAVAYLPYIVPFALATVIGGIDCAESAASVGDDYNTNTVIGIEAVATILAALCGGIIQTTPYIGHPAYKAMGGRAAYTLATALFVGGAGLIGYFGLVLQWIPEAAVLPILVFIGIEITAQSFHATPRRHYAALALACIPALAKLVMIYLGQYLPAFYAAIENGVFQSDGDYLQKQVTHLSVLAGGFIVTSLLWASATAKIIDRRFYSAATYFALGGMLVLFGVIHSPLDGDRMFLPWNLSDPAQFDQFSRRVVLEFAVAYLIMSILMFLMGYLVDDPPINSDEEYERLAL